MLSLESAILIIGIVQGVFLILTLMAKSSNKHQANHYLMLLLSAFVMALSAQWLSVSGYAENMKPLFVIASSVVFLFGPLLYFYVKSLTLSAAKVRFSGVPHIVPFCCYLVLVSYAAFFSTAELKIVTDESLSDFSAAQLLLPLLKLAHVISYTVVCLVLLIRYARRIKQCFSNIDNINLLWLRNLVIGFILFELALIAALLFDLNAFAVASNADTILSFVLVLLIFMTGFYGMHQPAILQAPFEFAISPRNNSDNNIAAKNDDRIAGPKNLRPEDVSMISSKLAALTSQRIYLDRFLNLQTLSDLVGVSQHKMSEYLNSHIGMTFYEYVNKARIEDAKQRLIDSQQSILDIALDVGFNNKATFNKAFKSFESATPSEFRRRSKAQAR
ncbi:helix-turn-helix domain-containing protein [Arsukibacterium perlucidum]|uniref:helix-turn-helix domain-containing protein n=1 Tax=Arsukibacterium perlucidum TaxID=368811 RepID=UPI00036C0389|nr:helix-turn-helix domain-containing protein [Arsukibacterium perlucidum]